MGLKPYYEHDDITIYHADMFDVIHAEVLPKIHAVCCDPPYASGGRTEVQKPKMGGMLRGVRWANKPIENDAMTTTGYVWLMRNLAIEVKPYLVKGAAFFAFIDWRNWPQLVGAIEAVNFRSNGMIVWDKGTMGVGHYLRKQHELIYAGSNGPPRVEVHNVPDVLRYSRVPNDEHPSPKPEGLMERLVSISSTVGDVIFDPFMGGGPTLVAAKRLGRKAVGVDVVERYCEIAAKRCERALRG